jgi:ribonucleoside-triphosphate reductase (formate)
MYNEVLDELVVVKRSGQRVEFNASKIAIAIKSAFDSVYENPDEKKIYKVFEKVLTYINENYKDRKTINVEDIQDIIESKLQSEKYLDVYNSFSEYRKKRAASRKAFAEKQQHKFVKAIEKIQEDNNIKTDSYLSPYNTLYKFGRIVSSEYSKSYVLDSKFVKASEEGNIFIHDIDYFSLGLLSSIHLKLNTNALDDNCIDNLINEVINTQNEINGEIEIDSIDYLLAPFILNKYKFILKRNLSNYLNVCGFLPFMNIKKIEEFIDREISLKANVLNYNQFIINENIENIFENSFKDAANEINYIINKLINKIFNALENNQQRNTRYSVSTGKNLTDIGNKINTSILNYLKDNNTLNNVCVIFKIKKNNEALIQSVSELIINKKNVALAFIESTYNKGNKDVEYFSNGARIYENINDSEKLSTGRMVVSTTSINLARLGLKYHNKDIKDFYTELDSLSELTKNELLLSFETIGNKNRANYKVLFNGNVYDDEKLEENQKIRKVIKNGTLNIGLVGLKECIESLESEETKQYDLLINILKIMNQKCSKYSEETKLNFGLFEPSDHKSRQSLLAIDKAIYGINSITDKNTYELIDSLKSVNNDYEKLSNIQEQFRNGEFLTINLSSNVSIRKVVETINNLIEANIGFAKIKVGK